MAGINDLCFIAHYDIKDCECSRCAPLPSARVPAQVSFQRPGMVVHMFKNAYGADWYPEERVSTLQDTGRWTPFARR